MSKGFFKSLTILGGFGSTLPLLNEAITLVPEAYAIVVGAVSGLLVIYRRVMDKRESFKEIKGLV